VGWRSYWCKSSSQSLQKTTWSCVSITYLDTDGPFRLEEWNGPFAAKQKDYC
jgi:hypothetical protein